MNYLVFRIYGPMASWGEIAVGEARHSAAHPSKSAICGLLGAALGLQRSEEDTHQLLANEYLQAVKMECSGHLLKDYHTSQAPHARKHKWLYTRRDEAVAIRMQEKSPVKDDRNVTILSSREYRTDALAIVALCASQVAPYSVEQLQQALRYPVFQLYLGRKSCPLAVPLDPQIIDSDTFKSALDAYQPKPLLPGEAEWHSDRRWLKADSLTRYYWEGVPEDFFDQTADYNPSQVQTLVRYDKPLSRRRWQFKPRKEYLWLDQKKDTV